MLDTLKIFLVLFILVLLIDIPVISLLFKSRWEKTIKNIQGSNLNIKPIYAFITYILIPIGLLLFVYPKIDNKNWLQTSLLYGFLFGLAVYGTYSFTSCTYYKNYTYYDGFKDTIWGIILYCIVGLIFIYNYK
jgi:uncharacterized membrane protein